MKRTITNRIRITASTREGIIAQIVEHLPRMVPSMGLHCEGYEPCDWLAEARLAVVETVDAWFSREGAHARSMGVSVEQFTLRRIRLKLIDAARAAGAKGRQLGTPLSQIAEGPDTGEALAEIALPLAPGPSPAGVDVQRALGKLSPLQRRCVLLHFGAGHTVDEVAEILGIPKHKAQYHTSKGQQLMQQQLKAYGEPTLTPTGKPRRTKL